MAAHNLSRFTSIGKYIGSVWPFSRWSRADTSVRGDAYRSLPHADSSSWSVHSDSEAISQAFWNYGGHYIGSRTRGGLFHRNGHQIGYFAEGNEIYGCSGGYLGEVRGQDRLVTNTSKKSWSRLVQVPYVLEPCPGRFDLPPISLLPGYEDFPSNR